jgi:hypothetical protein
MQRVAALPEVGEFWREGAVMSFESVVGQPAQAKYVLPSRSTNPAFEARKIEQSEFELLLQRAMEIVNAHALEAALAAGQEKTISAE